MRGPMRAHAWIVALAAAVTACSPSPSPPLQWSTVAGEDPNPIQVKVTPVSHTVQFAAAGATLSPEATASLQAFLRDQHARRGETATVKADDSPLGEARRSRVIAALRQSGLGAEPAPPSGDMARNTLVVTLERSTIVLPHCPNWPQLVGNDSLNEPSGNFGCATANDLAVLVADPNDLVRGHEPGPAPGEPVTRAVEVYRSGGSAPGSADAGKSGGGSSGGSPAPTSSSTSSTTTGGSNAQ
jgi:pilus assembly protein CpaD